MTTYWKDFAERLGWTVVEVGAGFAVVDFTDIKAAWVIPVTAALMAVKGFAAKKIGDPNTAAISSGQ